MHGLLRAYAANVAGAEGGTESDQGGALGRLLDYYLAAAAAAMNTLVPGERRCRQHVPSPATPLPDVASPSAARAWLDGERAVLVRVAGHAADGTWPTHAIKLSSVLRRYLGAGHYTEIGDKLEEARAWEGPSAAASAQHKAIVELAEATRKEGRSRSRVATGTCLPARSSAVAEDLAG
jgi:hypothetical protein